MKTPEPADLADPEPERLFLPDIAKMAGVSYSTIKTYYLRGQARFPEPEIQRVQAVGEPYRTRPWWRREVIEAWIAQRPARATTTATESPAAHT
jgi:predicted DNA-binding transcriptional regulator AlpA